MQIVINLGALLAISVFLADRFHDRLTETVPVSLCSMGIVLYVLAFFQKLHWISGVLTLCLLLLGALFMQEARRAGFQKTLRRVCGPLRDPQFWINAAALTVLIFLVNYRQVLEWDAYTFWGPDIKSLFYRNGFAEKFSNVSPQFGDYPPNVQLMIWWFLHMAGRFEEGLLFGGYFLYGGLLLFSVAGRLRLKRFSHKLMVGFIAVPLLFALPSVVDSSWYRSLYVDPVMAILWGCLLCSIVLDHSCAEGFQQYKRLVWIAAITLTKSVGIMWAVYAVICYVVWNGVGKKHLLRAGGMTAAAVAAYTSWSLYCRLLERTTYLTDSISSSVGNRVQELLQGAFFTSGHNLAYIKAYIKAFLFESVHRAQTRAIDLTPVLVMLLVCLVFCLFCFVDWLPRRKLFRLMAFILGVYGVTYFVLLSSHLTIFYYETQYLEPANMLTQMTRYGAPMNLGFLILAAALLLEKLEFPPAPRVCVQTVFPCLAALAVVLCSGYSVMADCLIEGHDPLNPKRLEHRARFLDSYGDFLEEVDQVPLSGQRRRVLVLCSEAEYNPVVTFFASPVSVQTARYSGNMSPEALLDMVNRSGASWVYIQDGTEAELTLLDSVFEGCRIQTLYALSR